MIDQSLRESLQTYYSSFLSSTQFRARYGQRLMIAELARRLAVDPDAFEQSPIALVEAGTGTGKTVAYALTGFAVAAAQDKTLVISTATVALQEQLVLRDLEEIQKHAGIEFSYALAKGLRSTHRTPIVAATTSIVVFTIFVVGGGTRTLLLALGLVSSPDENARYARLPSSWPPWRAAAWRSAGAIPSRRP